MNKFNLYSGQGSDTTKELPLHDTSTDFTNPATYIASKGLSDAVNVALALGQPLLLTGEPGTGKTQLAHSIAHEFDVGSPFIFQTKSSSVAKDLFYRYDSIGHFHAAQFNKEKELKAEDFVHFEALGKAIIRSNDSKVKRSVVLIDEIDKAPRDFPNDILNELEGLTFRVNETGIVYECNPVHKPVVILTSNSEKNLPDAFLRRCVFYHIPFPERDELIRIVRHKVQLSESFHAHTLSKAIDHFEALRRHQLKKKPATAELLSWVKILDQLGVVFSEEVPDKEKLSISYSVLAKNREDLQTMKDNL